MNDGETFSDAQIHLIHRVTLFCLFCNLAAYALSLTVILRFTRDSMADIKFHLLNISLMVFLSDLTVNLLAAPLPVYPFVGLVSVSGAGSWLVAAYGNQVALWVIEVTLTIALSASAAAVCNATLHRFWVTWRAEAAEKRLPKWMLGFMVVWQFGYMPLMAGLIATVEPVPDYVQRIYEEQFPDTLAKLSTRPHILIVDVFRTLRENPIFSVGIFMAIGMILYSMVSTPIFAWLSLRLLRRVRLSARALRLRRLLIVAMLLQSFLPVLAYFLGLLLVAYVLFLRPERSTPQVVLCHLIFGMHSVINCAVMCSAIPPYRRGLCRLFRFSAQRLMAKPTQISTESVMIRQREPSLPKGQLNIGRG